MTSKIRLATEKLIKISDLTNCPVRVRWDDKVSLKHSYGHGGDTCIYCRKNIQGYIVHDARFTPEMMAVVDLYSDLTVVAIESIIYMRFPECSLKYFELRKLIFKQLQRIDSAGKNMKD